MTLWTFLAMAIGCVVVIVAGNVNSFPLYLVGFMALFVFSGVGNGSTYKMIPAIFKAKAAAKTRRVPRKTRSCCWPGGSPGR